MTVRVKTRKAFNVRKLFRYAWHELMYGGHIGSLGASATVLFVTILAGQTPSFGLVIIPYMISQLVYAYNRHKDLPIDLISNPERSQHMIGSGLLFQYSIYFYIVSLIFLVLLTQNLYVFLLIVCVLALGLMYPKRFTKKIIGFKNFYVASLWTIAFVSMPYIYYGLPIDNLYVFLAVFIFIRVLLNTTFFDLKDIAVDKIEGLKTMPVIVGYDNTLLLLTLYNILSGLVILFAVYLGVMDIAAVLLLLVIHYSFYYLFLAYKIRDDEKIRRLSYVMVDGEYVFWPILLIVGIGYGL